VTFATDGKFRASQRINVSIKSKEEAPFNSATLVVRINHPPRCGSTGSIYQTAPNERSFLMSTARASIGAIISILSRRQFMTIFRNAARSSRCAKRYGCLPSGWYFSTYHIFSGLSESPCDQLRTKHERCQELQAKAGVKRSGRKALAVLLDLGLGGESRSAMISGRELDRPNAAMRSSPAFFTCLKSMRRLYASGSVSFRSTA
jgi:hypothetical protein